MAIDVEVKRADIAQKPVIFNLLQIYLHTFAALAGPDSPDWRFNALGQYEYPDISPYWTRKGWHPYLIYAAGNLAGFALVNDASGSGRPVDFFLQEFFVSGKYKRRGVGREAARKIFEHHRGRWELGTVPGNVAAVAFWKRVLKGPEFKGREELAGDGKIWPAKGAIFRFST
jgi:predicted acetyltransferase